MAINKRKLRHTRLRKKISGDAERPRLAVHFSGRHIQAQVIDDTTGTTLCSAHTTQANIKAKPAHANVATAQKIGKIVAEKAASKNITKIVFDRGGFKFHGKVKALADAVREGGINF